MQKTTFLIGLPGSGKTTYLAQRKEFFGDALICDDYRKSGGSEFAQSLYYEDLIEALSGGRDVVIADIAYCRKERLEEAVAEVRQLARRLGIRLKVEYLYFENDPEACKENILRRGRAKRVARELAFVDRTSSVYEIPPSAKALPVYGRSHP